MYTCVILLFILAHIHTHWLTHIHTHTRTRAHTYIHTHAYTQTHTYAHTHAHTHTYTHTNHICTFIFIVMYIGFSLKYAKLVNKVWLCQQIESNFTRKSCKYLY